MAVVCCNLDSLAWVGAAAGTAVLVASAEVMVTVAWRSRWQWWEAHWRMSRPCQSAARQQSAQRCCFNHMLCLLLIQYVSFCKFQEYPVQVFDPEEPRRRLSRIVGLTILCSQCLELWLKQSHPANPAWLDF